MIPIGHQQYCGTLMMSEYMLLSQATTYHLRPLLSHKMYSISERREVWLQLHLAWTSNQQKMAHGDRVALSGAYSPHNLGPITEQRCWVSHHKTGIPVVGIVGSEDNPLSLCEFRTWPRPCMGNYPTAMSEKSYLLVGQITSVTAFLSSVSINPFLLLQLWPKHTNSRYRARYFPFSFHILHNSSGTNMAKKRRN